MLEVAVIEDPGEHRFVVMIYPKLADKESEES
jgi:hypothetical protein